jgi:hypothetical protein
MQSFGILPCVTIVRIDVLEELSASIIRVTRIGELGTSLALTSNRTHLVIPSLLVIQSSLKLNRA